MVQRKSCSAASPSQSYRQDRDDQHQCAARSDRQHRANAFRAIMTKAISLGKKLGDMIKVSEVSPEKEHYPDLYISDTDDRRLAEMPDEGEATIRYRVVSRTHREEGKGKSKNYSCSLRLEVLSIEPPAANGKKKDSDNGARKALNDYFKE